ncbi:MAG TPA: fibronectin type III domain-containing protein, partial [Candidatus Limnocylindrales bacterium]|nr:fibronectin type III domain-containing protein [Candidatus Limnocylindrales bacterium]
LLLAAGLAASLGTLAACGSDDDDGTGPTVTPPLGLTVTPKSTSELTVTFSGTAGDNSYSIERAEGTAGTFAEVTTVPYAAGTITYTDASLKVNTEYRYRVAALRGSTKSAFTSEVTARTKDFGNAAADLTGDITANRTLFADTAYTIKGFVHVANGATLTIQAGTKIFGDFNTLGSSLFILRGAKINAIGTAAAPIIFTSSRPVGQRQPGDWGGLIIVGNARINRSGTVDVEGTGTDNTTPPGGKNYNVAYSGGTTDTDNSGTLSYVRVEFAGYAPSLNNELNSFTFAAVGSGTRVSYLQSMAGLDDSFEFFGGGLVGDHLVSYEAGDDHFDMSEGFRGTLQYLIAFQSTQLTPRTGSGSIASDPEGIENDGCSGSGCDNGFNSTPLTVPVVANFTLVGTGSQATSGTSGGFGMMIRRGTGGFYVNGIVARFPGAGASIRDADTYARAGSIAVPDLATADLGIKNVLFAQDGAPFQSGAGQFSFDMTGNALVNNTTATAASLFTAFPATVDQNTTAAAFDWTPPAGSPAASGGLAAFTGKLATAAGAGVTGTTYVGAAEPGGAKWWQGWTTYAQR